MRDLPEPNIRFRTKRDWEILLADSETKQQAVRDLKALRDLDDDRVFRTISLADPNDPESEDIMEEIDNPKPAYKHAFGSRQQISQLLQKHGVPDVSAEEKPEGNIK